MDVNTTLDIAYAGMTAESARLKVISNSAVMSVRPAPGGRAVHVFHRSPRMSTYLFFLGVGKYEESSKKSGNLTVVAATRPGQSKRAAARCS